MAGKSRRRAAGGAPNGLSARPTSPWAGQGPWATPPGPPTHPKVPRPERVFPRGHLAWAGTGRWATPPGATHPPTVPRPERVFPRGSPRSDRKRTRGMRSGARTVGRRPLRPLWRNSRQRGDGRRDRVPAGTEGDVPGAFRVGSVSPPCGRETPPGAFGWARPPALPGGDAPGNVPGGLRQPASAGRETSPGSVPGGLRQPSLPGGESPGSVARHRGPPVSGACRPGHHGVVSGSRTRPGAPDRSPVAEPVGHDLFPYPGSGRRTVGTGGGEGLRPGGPGPALQVCHHSTEPLATLLAVFVLGATVPRAAVGGRSGDDRRRSGSPGDRRGVRGRRGRRGPALVELTPQAPDGTPGTGGSRRPREVATGRRSTRTTCRGEPGLAHLARWHDPHPGGPVLDPVPVAGSRRSNAVGHARRVCATTWPTGTLGLRSVHPGLNGIAVTAPGGGRCAELNRGSGKPGGAARATCCHGPGRHLRLVVCNRPL